MSNPDSPPPASSNGPNEAYALPNTRIVIFTPLVVALLGVGLMIVGQADPLTAVFGGLIYAIPVAIAYAICLIWRRRLKPWVFFFAGIGMTMAVSAALIAMAFGTCLVLGVTGQFG